ncbi:MAG: PASTA domain-containing protein [Gemmatimonadetes bacterium]|nr:PASTA domain-containing protein [Gemmatimonadota bacterium]
MSFERRRTASTGNRLATFVRSRAGRGLVVTLVTFFAGYTVAARVLFPSADDPTDANFTEVPDLSGIVVEEAAARLTDLGFVPSLRGAIHHPEIDAGHVLAQSPLAGQVAREGDTIYLMRSSGRETRVVPELVGLASDEAATLLRRLGFDVDVVRSSTAARAGVIETSPEAGIRVTLPATIQVVVAQGAEIVPVPDLRGRHVDDVEGVLEGAQLRLGAVRYQVDAPEGPGRVVSQSPAPSSSLRSDGFVSIVVAGTPPDSVNADLTDETDPPRRDSTVSEGPSIDPSPSR